MKRLILITAAACFLWSFSQPNAVAQHGGHSSAPIRRHGGRAVQLRSDLVTLRVTVTDLDGRLVSGLRKERFTVCENKIEQQIAFFSQEDAPVSLGIILDISRSMKNKIGWALKALNRFLETCHEDDDIFLVGFNHHLRLISDFTTLHEDLNDGLLLVQPKGRTALYDAVYLGIEKVRRGSQAKRALLIISDGQDNSSRYNFRSVRKSIRESDIIIYGIGVFNLYGSDLVEQAGGMNILQKITEMTGGRAFFPVSRQQLIDVCRYIALELRQQYSIGYIPTNRARDRKWRKLKVKVRPPDGWPRLRVRTRKGYYAGRE